jgi:predicted  nucleic acid-binding Zn-ribbon protein
MKKQTKKTDKEKEIERIFKGSEVMVLIEDFNSKVGLLAEGQQAIREDLREFKDEMYGFRDEMYGFRDEMHNFKQDTEANFRSLREYLSRIEDELMDIKAELAISKQFELTTKDWIKTMEKRVVRIETQLQRSYKLATK